MSQGRVYSVSFTGVSVSAAQDLFELTPADDKPIQILQLSVEQYGVSDVGDAQEELLRWSIVRGNTTSGSGGGTNPTPRPMAPTDAAAGFTCEINNTTQASAGTGVILHQGSFNIRAGLNFFWPDGCEPSASQANTTIRVSLDAAPADAITFVGNMLVRELG